MYSLRDDPQQDQIPGLVVPDVVKAGEVLVQPVEHSLADGHDGGGEAQQDGEAGGPAGYPPPRGALPEAQGPGRGVPDGDVQEVHERLDDVQGALGGGEAVAQVVLLEAVHVVDLAVELVRLPDRGVGPAAGHGGGPAEHVAGVPDHEGQRHGEPEEGGGRGRVGPARGGRGLAFRPGEGAALARRRLLAPVRRLDVEGWGEAPGG